MLPEPAVEHDPATSVRGHVLHRALQQGDAEASVLPLRRNHQLLQPPARRACRWQHMQRLEFHQGAARQQVQEASLSRKRLPS